jgi:hypothetical protein
MEFTLSETKMIQEALICQANWIETGNPVLSASDAAYQYTKQTKRLEGSQIQKIKVLRDLADRLQSSVQALVLEMGGEEDF